MSVRRILVPGAFAVISLFLAGRANAAQNILLDVPGMQGESSVSGYVNQIDVLAVSFGAANPACSGGAGANTLSELNITKYIDRASVPMQTALKDHTVNATATIRFVRSDGQYYQSYVLSNVVFSSWSVGGSGGEDRSTEVWSLSFSQAVVTYRFVDGAGKVGSTQTVTLVPAVCPGS